MTAVTRVTLVALLVGLVLTLALLAFGLGGGWVGGSSLDAAKAANRQSAQRHSSKAKARRNKAARRHGKSAKRQVAAKSQGTSESETGTENESAAEPAGEAQPGHEDPAGQDVQHECPPDCAPGELP